ncbi:MAG: APC family permease [Candidatus Saccharimonadales bacterium]
MFINRQKHKLKRNIGLFMLCVIGIDGTIGGGVFVLLSHGAGVAGQFLPLSFLLGGILAFLGALLYAELGTTIPRSGADLQLVFNATRHRYYPFIFSWLVLLGDVGYLAINAFGLAFYANFFFSVSPFIIALGALLVAVAINLWGSSKAGGSEVVTGLSLLGLLLLYAVLVLLSPGFSFAPGEFIALVPANTLAIIAGTSLIFTTFVGYEYIASIAEEVKDPGKNIPRALMITIAVATTVFVLVSWVTVNAVPVTELAASGAPFLLIAEQLGPIGLYVVIPAALIATAGSLLAATLVSSRRIYALSEQGYFNKFFSRLSRTQVPYRAVLAVAVLAVFLLMSNSITFVAYISNTVYLLGLIVIAIALMNLRRQRPYLARPFRVPFFPWIPIILIITSIGVLFFIGVQSLAATLVWALIGYFIYLTTRIQAARLYWAMWGAMVFLLLGGGASVWYLL